MSHVQKILAGENELPEMHKWDVFVFLEVFLMENVIGFIDAHHHFFKEVYIDSWSFTLEANLEIQPTTFRIHARNFWGVGGMKS